MLSATRRVLDRAISLDASVYHFHDPELIPAGLQLRRMRKRVIFDSHEDVPKQLLGKPYLGPLGRMVLPRAASVVEQYACKRFNGIVAATPFIRDKFLALNEHTVDINNFPLVGELDQDIAWEDKRAEVCYVGAISAIRGIREIVRACEFLQSGARLTLAGRFDDARVANEVKGYPGWQHVNDVGYQDRTGVRRILGHALAGIVTLHPTINYVDALPVKMFEYMAAGIPVIASDIPLWQDIVEKSGCGLCVNPMDPQAIADAVDYLVTHPKIARSMGENGRKAVLATYNWKNEEQKLLRLYASLA